MTRSTRPGPAWAGERDRSHEMENRLTIERPEFTLFPVINNSVFCVLSDPCAVHPGFTRMPHTTRVCCVWWNRSIVGSLAGHQLWGIVYYYYLLIDSNFELFSLVSLISLSCFLGLLVSTCRSRASGCTSARNVATSTLSTSKASVCRVTSSTGTKPSNCKLLLFSIPAVFVCVYNYYPRLLLLLFPSCVGVRVERRSRSSHKHRQESLCCCYRRRS